MLGLVFFVYALLPYNIVYSVTLWKDVPFGASALLLAVAFYRLVKNVAGKWDYAAFALGAVGMALMRPAQLRRLLTGRRRVLWRTLLAFFAAGLVCIDIVLGLMIRQSLNRPTGDAPRTVLVLGCEVRGLRPSPMLSARIDSAYDYLTTHPEAVCVACGGMADDEIISEAQCIRDELVRRGIDPRRIYMEDKSENTAFCISPIVFLPANIMLPQIMEILPSPTYFSMS